MNTLLNYPALDPASTTQVTGTACAACRVEVYKAVAGVGGRGVGQKLIGVVENTAGDGSFLAWVTGVSRSATMLPPSRSMISATRPSSRRWQR